MRLLILVVDQLDVVSVFGVSVIWSTILVSQGRRALVERYIFELEVVYNYIVISAIATAVARDAND